MTERWQERRVENELLKRELLLRLRAEHSAVPGRGEPATDYFRRRVRWLLLRHPLFALKLYLLLLDVGLGRGDPRKPSDLGDFAETARRPLGRAEIARATNPHTTRAFTPAPPAPRRGVSRRSMRPHRDLALAYQSRQRMARGLRSRASATAGGASALRRQRVLWLGRLVHGLRLSKSFARALAADLRRAGVLLLAGVVRAVRSATALAARLVTAS